MEEAQNSVAGEEQTEYFTQERNLDSAVKSAQLRLQLVQYTLLILQDKCCRKCSRKRGCHSGGLSGNLVPFSQSAHSTLICCRKFKLRLWQRKQFKKTTKQDTGKTSQRQLSRLSGGRLVISNQTATTISSFPLGQHLWRLLGGGKNIPSACRASLHMLPNVLDARPPFRARIVFFSSGEPKGRSHSTSNFRKTRNNLSVELTTGRIAKPLVLPGGGAGKIQFQAWSFSG